MQFLALITFLAVVGFFVYRFLMRSPSTDRALDFNQPQENLDAEIDGIRRGRKRVKGIADEADRGIRSLKTTRNKAQEFLSDD